MPEWKAIVTTVVAAVAVVSAAVAAIYVFGGRQGNTDGATDPVTLATPTELAAATAEQEKDCETAPDEAERLDDFAVGQVAAFRIVNRPISLVSLSFGRPDGTTVTLADFAGRTVLLNLWATWCGPCRIEMPALDRLSASLGGERFAVVAVSVDTGDAARPRAFLEEIGVTALDLYVDPGLRTLDDLRRIGARGGLPTTILVGRSGCLLGIIEGPAEWASPDAERLINAAITL